MRRAWAPGKQTQAGSQHQAEGNLAAPPPSSQAGGAQGAQAALSTGPPHCGEHGVSPGRGALLSLKIWALWPGFLSAESGQGQLSVR